MTRKHKRIADKLRDLYGWSEIAAQETVKHYVSPQIVIHYMDEDVTACIIDKVYKAGYHQGQLDAQ